jgi:hypothetical protein
MLDIPYFWMGPLGGLMPIVTPLSGLQNALEKFSAEHVSAMGNRTYDVNGWRRTWQLTEGWLDPDDLGYLESMFLGSLGRVRLIDPLRKNRAAPGPAQGYRDYGFVNGLESFALPSPANGLIRFISDGDTPSTSFTSEGDQRVVASHPLYYTEWDLDGSSVPTRAIWLNGPLASYASFGTADARYVDPVVPGETITYSIYAIGEGGATATLSLAPVAATMAMAAVVGTSAASNALWTRLTVTYTVPSDGSVVGVLPVVRSTSAAGSIFLSKGQLELGTTATTHVPGLGCPEVEITALTGISPRHPYITAQMTIKEL